MKNSYNGLYLLMINWILGYFWVDSAMAPVGPLREYPFSCWLYTLASELVSLAARCL